MRRFYQPIDMRSRQAMTAYLKAHFRYPTANHWNRSTSYACNLKIHSLGMETEIVKKLFDLIQTDEFYEPLNALKLEFGERHGFLWQAGMNGRSGGYLVLYQGEIEPSGYKSFCIACGQQNYKMVSENGATCGRCGKPSRRDYPKTHMRVATYPGRGTDDGEDFKEWSMYELRARVELVQDFDRLADAMVQEAIYQVKHFSVEEESFMVEKRRKVLVANE